MEYTKRKMLDMGYSQTQALDSLMSIWNIIGEDYVIQNRYLILSGELIQKINRYIEDNGINKKLNKRWDLYKNNLSMDKGVISINEYNQLVRQWQEETNIRNIREAEIERAKQENYKADLSLLDQLKEIYQKDWLDSNWIKAMIGTYDNPFCEYYWTLIGRSGYKVKDWKGNIVIREDVYKLIEEDKTFRTYSGRNFLSRSFKNKKGYRAYIEGSYPILVRDKSGYGIYGIYYEEELVYIGMTQKGFESRWKEHLDIFKGLVSKPAGMILYNQNMDISKISFGKIINVDELNYEGVMGGQELKGMELACISLFKPKYNVLGVKKPYVI